MNAKKSISLDLPNNLKEQLDKIANETDLTRTAIIKLAIYYFLRNCNLANTLPPKTKLP